MRERTRRNIVKLTSRTKRGESENAYFYITFIFCKQYEELKVIAMNNYFRIHTDVNKYFTADCWVRCTNVTEDLGPSFSL